MPNLTLRARLTLVYGGLFIAGGVLMLFLTYSLVSDSVPEPGSVFQSSYTEVRESEQSEEESPPPPLAEGQDVAFVSEVWENAVDAIRYNGSIALALVSVGTIALGWLVAGRMLRPLQQVTDTAARIAEAPAADRGLHERIRVEGPRDELRELSETFNRMLERLDGSFDGQRRFVANASHELRTPLTLTRALLEVALHRPGASAEVRQLGETLLAVNARHERLIEGLLLLTRSDRELSERAYVDLADVAEHVVAMTDSGGVTVSAETAEAATTGDPVLLERLVHNLVENAVRYNLPEDGWVRVATETDGDHAVLEVSNSGPVVPVFEVEGLFEPFRRAGTERLAGSDGAGLGLSIVRAISRAHNGEVTATPRPEGGLRVTVTLPGAGQ